MEENITRLIDLSRRYGRDPEYVLAGGGNTSVKAGKTLLVKASGKLLADITEKGFVRTDLEALGRMWEKAYPEEPGAREAEVLKDLMAAVHPEDKDRRPSVETLLHAALPQKYVVHTHPPLVNGITCARNGKKAFHALFPEALWIDTTTPGYLLAGEVKKQAEKLKKERGAYPEVIFMENHGLVTAGETPEKIEELHAAILRAISGHITRRPDTEPSEIDTRVNEAVTDAILDVLEEYSDAILLESFKNGETEIRTESREAFSPLLGQITPDHMMYYGYRPLFVPAGEGSGKEGEPIDRAALRRELEEYHAHEEGLPRIIAVEKTGIFVAAEEETKLIRGKELFVDALKIAAVAENFGGVKSMPRDLVEFIMGWEAKKYQKSRIDTA